MAGPAAKILVVDDEPGVRELVGLHLRHDGHAVIPAADGAEALRLFRRTRPDLVVLDLTLPGPGGLEVCRRIQSERRVPLIVLAARGNGEGGIAGLELGADDYVVKPFSPRELAARVRAVLRRSNTFTAGPAHGRTLDFGDLRLEPDTRKVTVRGGTPVTLTEREFDLLHHLASHPKRAHARAQLMKAVGGHAFPIDTRTITVHVRRLREKIEPDPARPRYIQTVWGVGYKFGGDNGSESDRDRGHRDAPPCRAPGARAERSVFHVFHVRHAEGRAPAGGPAAPRRGRGPCPHKEDFSPDGPGLSRDPGSPGIPYYEPTSRCPKSSYRDGSRTGPVVDRSAG